MKKILLLKAHIATYTRADGTTVAAHDDHRRVMLRRAPRATPAPEHDDFDDDMVGQVNWLTDRAREQGFSDVDDMLERDPTLFARLAVGWREQHPRMAKSIDDRYARMLARRHGGDEGAMAAEDEQLGARADGWTKPSAAQAEAGNYKKPRIRWNGLDIAIENPVGTVREGIDETGRAWRTEFKHAYGEVCRTEGVDGDPVDVYMGPDESAPEVYIVRQMKRKNWDQFDEDKCFLGFDSMESAKAAYLEHYDDPRFYGGIIGMPLAEFVKKVRATRHQPGMLKSVLFLMKSAAPS